MRDAFRDARRRARPDAGQATVEFALVLPLLFALLVLLFQVALVGRDEILVVHAARDAARAEAVAPDLEAARAAARRTLPGASVQVLSRGGVGGVVRVEVSYVSRTDLPLFGALVPDVTLRATSVMRVEDLA